MSDEGPSKFVLYAALSAGFAVGVLALVVVISQRRDQAQPPPLPPTLEVTVGEIHTVPEVAEDQRRDLEGALATTLTRLYRSAFVREGTETPAASPIGALWRIEALFSAEARSALNREPDVFLLPSELSVARGEISFSGVATYEGAEPAQALLEVHFRGRAAPESRTGPLVGVRQRGTMLLVRSPEGWRVDEFELELDTRPVSTPTLPAS